MQGQGLHKRQKAKQEMEAASPPKLVTSEFIQSVLKDIGVERGLIWLERTCWLASTECSFVSWNLWLVAFAKHILESMRLAFITC